jgi:hypothetical protein
MDGITIYLASSPASLHHKLTVYFNSSRFVSLISLKLLKYFPYVVYGEVDSLFKCHYF